MPVASSPAVCYAMPDWRSIMLQPLPSTGDTVNGLYAAAPAAMVANGDTPIRLPVNLHHLIVGHAAAIAMETVDIDRAMSMMEAFYKGPWRRAKSWINQQRGSRPIERLVGEDTAKRVREFRTHVMQSDSQHLRRQPVPQCGQVLADLQDPE